MGLDLITTRSAVPIDAATMANLINAIISSGGTTAHQKLYSVERMVKEYIDSANGISCVVAEFDGEIVGFQTLEWPYEEESELPDNWVTFPDNWAIIATFVRQGQTGRGIGRALFRDTRMAAANSAVETIDATIRADNTGGLIYYSRMGFVDYKTAKDVPLDDGILVDRISKRFDL